MMSLAQQLGGKHIDSVHKIQGNTSRLDDRTVVLFISTSLCVPCVSMGNDGHVTDLLGMLYHRSHLGNREIHHDE